MAPKTEGMLAGLCGVAGILLLEVLTGGLYGITSPVAGEDAVSVALLSFLGVSAFAAAVCLLVNRLISVWQTRRQDQDALTAEREGPISLEMQKMDWQERKEKARKVLLL